MPFLTTQYEISAAIRECVTTRACWTIIADTGTGRETLAKCATLLLLAAVPESDVRLATFRVLSRASVRSTVGLLVIPKAAIDAATLRAVLSLVGAMDLPPASGEKDVICVDARDARLAIALGNIAQGRAKLLGGPHRN